jgi:nicotinamidase-related amidase
MRHLLFTECLQNDFVAPLRPGAPLPNALHIGRAESRRLLGDPAADWASEGPLARFLTAWAAGATARHAAIHVRDWHDPRDPATRAHLDHFGPHCLRDSEGARFVLPLDRTLGAGARVVDSAILSDFVGTELEGALRPLIADDTRAGLIGVWTDVKVHYLAYDLRARFGLGEIAVCSALTASRSRVHHYLALQHMAANLGVTVIDSIPEFLAWLGVTAAVRTVAARGRAAARVITPPEVELLEEERRLVELLFRDCSEVSLEPLSGGFSGSRVFRSASQGRRGFAQVPFVVKIDTHSKIAQERVAVELVENLLGAVAPRLSEYVDLETRGAIKYQFASMHAGEVTTLQTAFRAAAGPAAVDELFRGVVARVLVRLYQRPQRDRLHLFRYYSFEPRHADNTLARIGALAREAGPDGVTIEGLEERFPYPGRLYARVQELRDEEPYEVACCWIHGDLNLANVLIDATGNTWLIDYFWSRLGHALQDVAKLENDLKFILVPLADDAALARAVAWERLLLAQDDLTAAPPELPGVLAADRGIAKAHAAIRILRELAARIQKEAGCPGPVPRREYTIAQLRYSAHTLSFDECDDRQKRFALASTCLLAGRLSGAAP